MAMRELGYNTRGTGDYFEKMLKSAIPKGETFQYLEIGVAEGQTMRAVRDILDENNIGKWAMCGVEIVHSPFFNPYNFMDKFPNDQIDITTGVKIRNSQIAESQYQRIRVFLTRGDRFYFFSPFHFVLIDGCHGAPCVEKDFLSIENSVKTGGIVAFHDAGAKDQGIHFQEHCQQPISVRKALQNLNLLGESRFGWKHAGSISGDKSPKDPQKDGHGFEFFIKL